MVIPLEIKEEYNYWQYFLRNNVDFWHKTSDIHTKEHCERVLLFALLIADKMGLEKEDRNILAMASVFHDSRRQDDWYDVGHGQRAADYYKEYCSENNEKFEKLCYNIMYYHDRDDKLGIEVIENEGMDTLLYKIFKDSDALDRFRLGPNGLDEKYLRTEEAKSLCDYARKLWQSISQE